MIRNHCVNAHAEADSERVYQILHRIDQRQCCYRVLSYFATNRLSMMLYSEFTSMETTIGSAIESSSGSIGFPA